VISNCGHGLVDRLFESQRAPSRNSRRPYHFAERGTGARNRWPYTTAPIPEITI
jgi:hypothetical protein